MTYSELPRANRRWILLNALAATAVLNALVNGAIAWFSTRGVPDVPRWSTTEISTVVDTVATLFLLPFITCLLSAVSIHHDLRVGRIPRLVGLASRLPTLARLPGSIPARALACGSASVVALAPVSVLLLVVTDFGHVSRAQFIVFKICFAVALGAVVTPLIALRAMADRVAGAPTEIVGGAL